MKYIILWCCILSVNAYPTWFYDYIKTHITTNNGEEDPYRWSHGADDMHLGDGLIIYTLVQFFKFKTLVCLGSGGGFIPRIMTQARFDLSKEGFYEEVGMEWGDNGSTYLVDACNGVNGEVYWEDKTNDEWTDNDDKLVGSILMYGNLESVIGVN